MILCFLQHLENFTLVASGRGQPFLDGKGQCPFDPQHTHTALLVGEYGAGGPHGWAPIPAMVTAKGGVSLPRLTPTPSLSRWRALRRHHEQLPGQRAHHLPLAGQPHPAQDGRLPPLALG